MVKSVAEQIRELGDRLMAIQEDTKEKFEPHMMYDPKTGEGKKANVEKDHLDMKAKGWGHEKPKADK